MRIFGLILQKTALDRKSNLNNIERSGTLQVAPNHSLFEASSAVGTLGGEALPSVEAGRGRGGCWSRRSPKG
jgi:hypothetical protein